MISKRLMFAILFAATGSLYSAAAEQRVEFTPEEWNLLHGLVSAFNPDHHFDDLVPHPWPFAYQCGFGVFSRSDSYNPDTYPDCAKVLEFLKAYKEKKAKFEAELAKETKEFYHTLEISKRRAGESNDSQETDSK